MVKSSVLSDGSVRIDFDAHSLPALLLLPGVPLAGYVITQDGVTMLDAAKQALLSGSISQEALRSLGLFQSSTGGN